MRKKEILTVDEKNWMDTIAVNYVLAQSDGYQLGYAQAIHDFTEYIVDYWNASDDKPQQSVLDALVDLGNELRKRQDIVKDNIEIAKERGFENYYRWPYKAKGELCVTHINLFTKVFEGEEEEEHE